MCLELVLYGIKEQSLDILRAGGTQYLGEVYSELPPPQTKPHTEAEADQVDASLDRPDSRRSSRSRSRRRSRSRDSRRSERRERDGERRSRGSSSRRESHASTIRHHDVVILDDDCNEQTEEFLYVDSQESLKGEREDVSVGTSDSRRGSLYFDETEGKYGTWKRRKLDRSVIFISLTE